MHYKHHLYSTSNIKHGKKILDGTMSGKKAVETTEIITVVGDSQIQLAQDAEETQLPCSPSEAPFTNVALDTLNRLDERDKNMQNQAFANQALNSEKGHPIHIYIYTYL